jgi:hypothetical protein
MPSNYLKELKSGFLFNVIDVTFPDITNGPKPIEVV